MATDDKSKGKEEELPTRRYPSHIQSALDAKDAEAMQTEMVARYGHRLDDQFVTDLRKHTGRKVKEMPALVASKDVATVRAEYRALYGEEISDQFAGDLIAYFEKAVKGDEIDS